MSQLLLKVVVESYYLAGTRPASLLYRHGIIILLEASSNVYDSNETSGQTLITKKKISEYFGKVQINCEKQVCTHQQKYKKENGDLTKKLQRFETSIENASKSCAPSCNLWHCKRNANILHENRIWLCPSSD